MYLYGPKLSFKIAKLYLSLEFSGTYHLHIYMHNTYYVGNLTRYVCDITTPSMTYLILVEYRFFWI